MTLHISFDQFAETVKRVLGKADAYVVASSKGTCVTAVHSTENMIVSSLATMSIAEAKTKLKKEGMNVYEGAWRSDSTEVAAPTEVYVAAVAYQSAGDAPGVWVDAYPTMPSQVQVLKAMFDEFRGTGELPDVSFDEFVRLARPTVVLIAPTEIESYLEAKQDC